MSSWNYVILTSNYFSVLPSIIRFAEDEIVVRNCNCINSYLIDELDKFFIALEINIFDFPIKFLLLSIDSSFPSLLSISSKLIGIILKFNYSIKNLFIYSIF